MSAARGKRAAPGISLWRRFVVRIITVSVLAVLVGAGWVLFRPAANLELTSYGTPVANAGQLLSQTEKAMRDAVKTRHGTLASHARCYFERSGPPVADAAQPVGNEVFCGPVLFVDGTLSRPFLTFNVAATPTAGGRMKLAVDGQDGDGTAADPRPAIQLVRPDGKQAPTSYRLATPRAPAAVGDVLTTTSLVRTPLTSAPPTASMAGQLSGVRLVEYGFVDSYGWGETARTAPSGYRLLAFATDDLAGESGQRAPDLSVRIDGNERGPLSETSDYYVTAVPKKAKQVDLVLTDSGVKQSISLLTGQPDSGNPTVTVRAHDRQVLNATRAVKVRLQTKAGVGNLTGTLTVKQVSLSYWAANGTRCPQPDQAWLHVAATLRLQGDKQAYGAESSLITVTVPAAGRLTSSNAAADPNTQVDDVVQVPASLTSGTLTFAGAVKTSKGTLTVLTPITMSFTIPAG